jgi:membrane associated rhomboid family serine protease
MEFNILIIFIAIIVGFSLKAFNDSSFKENWMFIPYLVRSDRQFYRFASHIAIHADWGHLLFNMMSLFFLGQGFLNNIAGEYYMTSDRTTLFTLNDGLIQEYGGMMGQVHFALIFLLGGLFAGLIPYARHNDHPWYRSLGASGAVSAVIFAAILWCPEMPLNLFFIPIHIPAYIFGPLYLLFEFIMDKRGNSGIAHDAHIGGALFGVLYVLLIDLDKGKEFLELFFH